MSKKLLKCRMMKVLYLIDTLEGYGAEKSIVQIAVKMQEVTPVFVHIYRGDNLKISLDQAGIKVYSFNLKKNDPHSQALKLLTEVIEKEKPDVLHSTLFQADMIARKLKKLFPQIILVGSFVSNSYGKHRYSHLPFLSKLKLFSTQFRDRISADKVDYFICNSNAIKKSNMKALGISTEKIRVISRGRSFNRTGTSCSSALKNDLKLADKKVFLNVGRLHLGKGQLDLLYAFKSLSERRANLVLLIAGEGTLRKQLMQTINKLDLDEKVYLLGYREDIPELLCLADYFVFPTYYEGLPGALIEAIVAKTPVIVSSIEENKECLPQEAGLYFEPGNIKDLSLKMEQSLFIDNWEERTNLAYNKALSQFNIDIISRKYENFYTEIVSKSL